MANWAKVTPVQGDADMMVNLDHVKVLVRGNEFTRLIFGFDNKEVLNVKDSYDSLAKLAGPSAAPAKKAAKKAASK